jgi:hypothetical protein
MAAITVESSTPLHEMSSCRLTSDLPEKYIFGGIDLESISRGKRKEHAENRAEDFSKRRKRNQICTYLSSFRCTFSCSLHLVQPCAQQTMHAPAQSL